MLSSGDIVPSAKGGGLPHAKTKKARNVRRVQVKKAVAIIDGHSQLSNPGRVKKRTKPRVARK
jgi:hypothetical protein